MELFYQTNEYNCGSACLAMVLNKIGVFSDNTPESAEDFEKRVIGRKIGDLKLSGDVVGLTADEISTVLWEYNIPHCGIHIIPSDLVDRHLEKIFDHIGNGGTAILFVPSLIDSDQTHSIVAEGTDLFDPNPDPNTRYVSLEDFDDDHPFVINYAFLIKDFQYEEKKFYDN